MHSEFVFTLKGEDVPTNRTSICFASHAREIKRETLSLQVSQREGAIFRLWVWLIRYVGGQRAGPIRSEFPREMSIDFRQVYSVHGHEVINAVGTGFASTGPGTGSEAEAQSDSKKGPHDASWLRWAPGYLTTQTEGGKDMREELP
jgi:hypothetical protein